MKKGTIIIIAIIALIILLALIFLRRYELTVSTDCYDYADGYSEFGICIGRVYPIDETLDANITNKRTISGLGEGCHKYLEGTQCSGIKILKSKAQFM